MKVALSELFEKRWMSVVSLVIIIGIIFSAYFFQQSLETYIGWGLIGLFVGCFLANATVLLPAPSILLVCQFALIYNPLITALVGGLGASIGEMIGYMAGRTGREIVESKRNGKIIATFQKHPYMLVFLFSVIPLPLFDVIGILSGASHLKWYRFLYTCWAGKAIKMLIYGIVFVRIANILPTSFDDLSWDDLSKLLPFPQ